MDASSLDMVVWTWSERKERQSPGLVLQGGCGRLWTQLAGRGKVQAAGVLSLNPVFWRLPIERVHPVEVGETGDKFVHVRWSWHLGI